MTTERLLAYEGQYDSAYKGRDEKGRYIWCLNQSRLKQVDTCPERGRRALLSLDSDGATDSNAMGRACHSAVEESVRDMLNGMGPWALADMVEMACAEFDTEMAMPGSRWVKAKNASTIHAQINRSLAAWYGKVMPTLRPVAVEVNFGPLKFYEDEHRVINVKGQIDYIDERYLGDWKFTGRAWEPWEHQRWDVQPTLYTWAYQFLDLPAVDSWGEWWPWEWHVFQTNGSYQHITTTRTPADWSWLKERCRVIAEMLEADLPAWPKNDSHALCSPIWCPSYESCKGQFIEDPKTQRK